MASTSFPQDLEGQISFIQQERKQVIQKLAMTSRRSQSIPDETTEPGVSLYPRLRRLLTWLDSEVIITPQLKDRSLINEALTLMFNNSSFHFPQDITDQARQLHEKWESRNWGAPAPAPAPAQTEESDEGYDSPGGGRQPRQRNVGQQASGQIKLPPLDHPVWGRDGIMHGLALKRFANGRKSTVLNPEYSHEQRDGKVFGHNRIPVGSWFPVRLAALFRGAHGHSQAGIHGTPAMGAWSVVISGGYEHLDQDRGEIVHYSGSGSHDNVNPRSVAAPTEGTKSLITSLNTGRPVRVLRTSDGSSSYAPSAGLRYDGLYKVTDKKYPKNLKGGLYEQFRLERLPVDDQQIPLSQCRARPMAQEVRDYERIKDGYISRR